MEILVVGASGATGRLLVEQLLNRECLVKVIVRSLENLPNSFRDNDRLSIICANVLGLSDDEMVQHVSGCEAVASCLGHTMSLKGIYGQPRRLVTDAVRRLCNAIKMSRPQAPVKFVLMNTAGNRNRDLAEPISLAQRGVVGLIRLLVPPHADNEQAADYLRNVIGQNSPFIEWVAVRPDDLVNELEVSGYEVYASPTRSAIFDAGSTSRINVSHFMAELVIQDALWKRWRGKMPVIYNSVISD